MTATGRHVVQRGLGMCGMGCRAAGKRLSIVGGGALGVRSEAE